jgi:Na+/proline symporter
VVLGSFFAPLVPYTADQAVIQRYLSTRDEHQAARAVWTGALLTVPTSLLFFGVGTALFVFYRTHPSLLNPALQTDATFSWFIAQQLPAGISGLAVSGVFAAAMSTLSSSINSITTAIVTDFYVRFHPTSSESARMSLARRLVLAVGGAGTLSALVLTTWDVRSLWDLFLESVGLFGSGLAGLFVLGVFTRRANGRGALTGALASVAVLYVVQRHTPLHFFLYALIGVATCVGVGYATSLLMPSAARSLDGLTIFTRRRLSAGSIVRTEGVT